MAAFRAVFVIEAKNAVLSKRFPTVERRAKQLGGKKRYTAIPSNHSPLPAERARNDTHRAPPSTSANPYPRVKRGKPTPSSLEPPSCCNIPLHSPTVFATFLSLHCRRRRVCCCSDSKPRGKGELCIESTGKMVHFSIHLVYFNRTSTSKYYHNHHCTALTFLVPFFFFLAGERRR